MKGLLCKELFFMKKYLSTLLLLLAVYFGISIVTREVTFLSGLSAIVCVMIGYSLFTYDNYANWDSYALSLPVSRKKLVTSRYLFVLLVALACFCLSLLCGTLIVLATGQPLAPLLFSLLSVTGISLVLVSFVLPIAYRFGVEKGRLYLMVVMIAFLCATMMSTDLSYALQRLYGLLSSALYLIPVALAALLYGSYRLSCHFYEKKEF